MAQPSAKTFQEIYETLQDIIAIQNSSKESKNNKLHGGDKPEASNDWQWEGTECFETKDKGKGVRATRNFKKGECIIRVNRSEMVDTRMAKKTFGRIHL